MPDPLDAPGADAFTVLRHAGGEWCNTGTHASLDAAMDCACPWEPHGIQEAGDGKAAYWRASDFTAGRAPVQYIILREPAVPSLALLVTRYRLIYSLLAPAYAGRAPSYAAVTGERASRLARLFPRHSSVLDIGCGTGQALAALSRAGLVVTGADISLDMARLAAGNVPLGAVICGSFLDVAHGPFGLLWDSAVFHLYPRACEGILFAAFRRLLQDGGALSISTTASAADCEGWEAKQDYPLGLRRWRRHLTPASLEAALERHGFTCVDQLEAGTSGKQWVAVTAVKGGAKVAQVKRGDA